MLEKEREDLKKSVLTEKEQESLKTFLSFKTTYPNFYRWIKIGTGIVILAVPFVIWIIYYIGENGKGILTNITAGDLLTFYGSLLAFVGTVALGSVSVYQTHKAQKLNEILINSKSIPSISIDGCANRDGAGDVEFFAEGSTSCPFLKSTFINISETAIVNISVDYINGNPIVKKMNNTALGINKSKKVFIWSSFLKESDENTIQLSLVNAIGDEYTQKITFELINALPVNVITYKPQRKTNDD